MIPSRRNPQSRTIVMLATALVLVISGALLAISRNKKSDVTKESSSSVVSSPLVKRQGSWKTYQNKQLGISFDYPAEYGEVKAVPQRVKNGVSTEFTFSTSDMVTAGLVSRDFNSNGIASDFEVKNFKANQDGTCAFSYEEWAKGSSVSCEEVQSGSRITGYIAVNTALGGEKLLLGFVPAGGADVAPAFTFVFRDISEASRDVMKQMLTSFTFFN